MNHFSDGRLKVGDEIINVCGRRLRGLTVDDAVQTLKQKSSKDLDIVISRDVIVAAVAPQPQQQPQQQQQLPSSTPTAKEKHSRSLPLIDTEKLFINEQRLRDEHRRITQRYSQQCQCALPMCYNTSGLCLELLFIRSCRMKNGTGTFLPHLRNR